MEEEDQELEEEETQEIEFGEGRGRALKVANSDINQMDKSKGGFKIILADLEQGEARQVDECERASNFPFQFGKE